MAIEQAGGEQTDVLLLRAHFLIPRGVLALQRTLNKMERAERQHPKRTNIDEQEKERGKTNDEPAEHRLRAELLRLGVADGGEQFRPFAPIRRKLGERLGGGERRRGDQ